MDQRSSSLEYTKLLASGAIFHYTCNAPSQEVLDHYKISTIGNAFDRDPREVLIIPSIVFEREGIPIPENQDSLKIEAENLLKRLKKP